MNGETTPAGEGQALQSALAAEHAAVFAYGVIGGVLDDSEVLVAAAYATHRGRRDQLIAMIGPGAVAADPVYELPFAVTRSGQAARLAVRVEERCAAAYAGVVERTTGSNRLFCARALADCAVRGLGWGAEPEPFPGLRRR